MIACTWWGHSTATVELGDTRVATDPLLTDRLLHLLRYAADPGAGGRRRPTWCSSRTCTTTTATGRRWPASAPDVPILAPRGAERLLARLAGDRLVLVEPGDVVERAGVRIEVLAATHDGRRHPLSREHPPALGFRFGNDAGSCWYPGDTELRDDMADVDPVDLALVPVGGWGPTLEEGHLDPEQAAQAVRAWAPVGGAGALGHVLAGRAGVRRPANHERLFTTPGPRFAQALAGSGVERRRAGARGAGARVTHRSSASGVRTPEMTER